MLKVRLFLMLFIICFFCLPSISVASSQPLSMDDLSLGGMKPRDVLNIDNAEQALGTLLKTRNYDAPGIQCTAYSFKDGEIRTFKKGNDNIIFSILLNRGDISTVRGIKIGSTLSEVIRVYGERPVSGYNRSNRYNYWVNHMDGDTLSFFVDENNGTVIGIDAGFHIN